MILLGVDASSSEGIGHIGSRNAQASRPYGRSSFSISCGRG